jgi:hypothetical protein
MTEGGKGDEDYFCSSSSSDFTHCQGLLGAYCMQRLHEQSMILGPSVYAHF